jgi:hypothetical protein
MMVISVASSQQLFDPYQFPTRPGSDEWKKLNGTLERYEVLQIPDTILSNLVTSALIETCLTFPFLIEIHTTENPQVGFEHVFKRFNGLRELFEREDAGTKILDFYEMIISADIKTWSELDKGKFSMNLSYLELMISQDKIIDKFTNYEIVRLRQIGTSLFERKLNDPSVFGGISLTFTALILAKLLKAENKLSLLYETNSEAEISEYLVSTRYSNSNLIYDIYRVSKAMQ